jgi:hypothetical protein
MTFTQVRYEQSILHSFFIFFIEPVIQTVAAFAKNGQQEA